MARYRRRFAAVKPINTYVLGGVIAVVLALAAFLYGRSLDATAESAAPVAQPREPGVLRFAIGTPQLAAVKLALAEEAPLPLAEPLNGRIAYNENLTARVASPIAGRVTSLTLQSGDEVKAGAPLLTLDSPELAAAVADLAKAEAEEKRSRLAVERARALAEGGVLPRKDLELAEADHVETRAESARARLRLRNLSPRTDGSSGFQLRAPIGGVIAERQVNPGTEVRPDLAVPLFVITDPTRLWVLVDLPERDLAKVERGHAAVVEVDAYPNERFGAVVERIGETVDPATRRIQVRLAIDNPQRRLKPEMYARVILVADEAKRAVRVPNTALVTQGVHTYVFVEREPGVFVHRRVAPLVQDREWTYLADGVRQGESMVVGGAVLLNSELAAQQQ
jgi:cobalt-zinc-cadmium efflux system membrane fusion protein